MIFTTPLGLLALLAIPAVVAIHLFRRRFPPRRVAGLFLWQLIAGTPEGGGRIDRLPVTPSLILECLAALALALLLAGARCSPSGVSQHLVVLLDDSASMGAVTPSGERIRDRAVERITSEIENLRTGARVSIVRSGDRPSVLVGPAALALEAAPALATWQPEAPHHSLQLGLRLARELAGDTGRLMVVSDAPPDARGERAFTGGLWAAVGEAVANVAITGAQRTLSPEHDRGIVSLTLVNQGPAAVRRVTIHAADKEILARDIDVPAGASSLTLPLPPGLPAVRVTLSDDALARDNGVVLAEPRPRIVGIDNRLPDGRGRDALAKALGVLAGVTTSASPHLVFVDASTLDSPAEPGVWRVGIGPAPDAWRAPGTVGDLIGPFVIEKRHPLLLGMTLGGVVWSGAPPVAPARIHPIVSVEDRPLIGTVVSRAADDLDVLVNLDLNRTNLIRAPDWPIFISNLVEFRRQHLAGPERWNYRIGEWVRVRLGRDPRAPIRYRMGALERELPPGRELEFLAPAPGGPLQIVEGDAVLFELGVNFLDERESDLRTARAADSGELVDGGGLRAESGPASDPLFWILLVLGAAAVLANWTLLGSRRAPAIRRPA